MNKKIKGIAAVGDNCMDVYDNTGEAYPGGNPVNVAVYYVRMGGKASYTGIVGSDIYGDMMVKAVKGKGVDVSHVRKEEGTTAITHVELIDGDRIMGDYEEGVMANFSLRDEDIDFICSHNIAVSALWGNAQSYFKRIRESGTKIAYDAAVRPEDPAAVEATPYVNYFFFASDDGDTPENRELMKKLYEKGPKLVILTLGEEGSMVFDGSEYIKYGIKKCDVLDTMGAGDSYIAGFLMGIEENKAIRECMKLGAENAAETIGYKGAW